MWYRAVRAFVITSLVLNAAVTIALIDRDGRRPRCPHISVGSHARPNILVETLQASLGEFRRKTPASSGHMPCDELAACTPTMNS